MSATCYDCQSKMIFLTLNWTNGLRLAVSVTVSIHENLVFPVSIERIVYFSVNHAPWQLWRWAVVKSSVFRCKECWLYKVWRSERKFRRLFAVTRFGHESIGIGRRSSLACENTGTGSENRRDLE